MVRQVKFGHVKLNAIVQVTTGAHIDVRLKITAPVSHKAYFNLFGFLLPATFLKITITSELGKVLEGALQGLVGNRA